MRFAHFIRADLNNITDRWGRHEVRGARKVSGSAGRRRAALLARGRCKSVSFTALATIALFAAVSAPAHAETKTVCSTQFRQLGRPLQLASSLPVPANRTNRRGRCGHRQRRHRASRNERRRGGKPHPRYHGRRQRDGGRTRNTRCRKQHRAGILYRRFGRADHPNRRDVDQCLGGDWQCARFAGYGDGDRRGLHAGRIPEPSWSVAWAWAP